MDCLVALLPCANAAGLSQAMTVTDTCSRFVMNSFAIRTLRRDEISLAIDWAAAEGWNPGIADAACFASVDPEGFLIAELDGAPVATVSCVNRSEEHTS